MKRILSAAGLLLATSTDGAFAADKSGYSLFNSTPRDEMRELSTDRPDQTESPYTVDAGHFQVEADIAKYTYNREKFGGDNNVTRQWDIASSNLKFGLTNSTDIQFIVDSFVKKTESDKNAGTHTDPEGFGDVTVRLKHNLWGNDGGKDAFGIMPYVKIPTNQNNLENDDVEGGFIVLYALDLGNGYGLGLMPQMDILKDSDGNGYHASFVQTATTSVEWTDKFASYYEIFLERGTDSGDHWNVMFDTGITYALTENIQLDTGINIGLTKSADDAVPFVGITYRY